MATIAMADSAQHMCEAGYKTYKNTELHSYSSQRPSRVTAVELHILYVLKFKVHVCKSF